MAIEVGLLSVRRAIFIAAPPERVWDEFTAFDRMKSWFGTGHELTHFEPGPGGYVETDAGSWQGERLVFGGRIVDWDPPHGLTFENDWLGHGWPAPTLFTFRLTAEGPGTIVELFMHGFERLGPAAGEEQAGFENGWTLRQLEALREIVQR